MPQVTLPPGVTDEEYVLGLLRATGVLCVYGSGFGAPAGGWLLPDRVPRLAGGVSASIYDDIGAFTAESSCVPVPERTCNPSLGSGFSLSEKKSLHLWTIRMTALAVAIIWAASSSGTSCSSST